MPAPMVAPSDQSGCRIGIDLGGPKLKLAASCALTMVL